jgi:hypothetical protein
MGMCAAWRVFPRLNEFHRILDDLWPKGTACSGFLLRGLAAPFLHFALVEAHGGIVPAAAAMSIRNHGRVDGH